MDNETIIDITDATSRTLYECDSGVLRLRTFADMTIKSRNTAHDGHKSTSDPLLPFLDQSSGRFVENVGEVETEEIYRYLGSPSSVFVDREVTAE